jgi:hypothetical protein
MYMQTNSLSIQNRARDFAPIVRDIQRTFKTEKDLDCEEGILIESLEEWFETDLDRRIEDMGEIFTSPGRKEFDQLGEILKWKIQHAKRMRESEVQLALFDNEEDAYNGFRTFSAARLGAMIEYIAFKGQKIFQTNLNKLLFYSDFVFYNLTRKGISGAIYVKLEFGPVPDGYRNVLSGLKKKRRVIISEVKSRRKNALIIRAMKTYNPENSVLSKNEIKVMDWVLTRYGALSSEEISHLSHEEKAYTNTRMTQPIAYEFAKFLKYPPPPSLLDT